MRLPGDPIAIPTPPPGNSEVTALTVYLRENAEYAYINATAATTVSTVPSGWYAANFDDSSWWRGNGPFGNSFGGNLANASGPNTPNDPGYPSGTPWSVHYDPYVRVRFALPAPAPLTIWIAVDNGINSFYINGILATAGFNAEGAAYRWEHVFDVPAYLTQAGDNLLALQLEDHGVATGFAMAVTTDDPAVNPPISTNYIDLTAESISTDALVADQQNFTAAGVIEFTARNIGNYQSPDCAAAIFLDVNENGQLDDLGDIVLGSAPLPPLAAGEAQLVAIPVEFPIELSTRALHAVVDSERLVTEPDEVNNYIDAGLGCSFQGRRGAVFTSNADFDQGTLVNVNHDTSGELRLNPAVLSPFPFIWVACSARGTIVRIDVNSGEILGEYLTSPNGRSRNPSRTTVDLNGNVWVGNRDEAGGGQGSIARVGLVIGGIRGRKEADGTFVADPTGQYLAPPFQYLTCEDRNADGLIETSRGLGNYLTWPNTGNIDSDGGVETATDECIINYVRIAGSATRTLAVDSNNDVWASGTGDREFEKISGQTGLPVAGTRFQAGCGGYGGLIDGAGFLWSATANNNLLIFDTANIADRRCVATNFTYGLGIDTQGNIWCSNWTSHTVTKISPDGISQGTWATGGSNCRGVAVTPADNHVWIANSGTNNVTRLWFNNGVVARKLFSVGATPTGVAVDANGKVWATNYDSNTVSRIDPTLGTDGLGAVDLTVNLGSGARPYNYSDMTGTVVTGSTAPQGTWIVIHDGGVAAAQWNQIRWSSYEPEGTGIKVEARAADDRNALVALSWTLVANGVPLSGLQGRFVEIRATLFRPGASEDTPVLFDLEVDPPFDVMAGFIRLACDSVPAWVTARLANVGALVLDAGLPVSFYDGDPALGGALLGTTMTLFPMRPGSYEDVSIDLPDGFDCIRRVWVVADDAGGREPSVGEGGRVLFAHDVNTFASSRAGAEEERFAVNVASWLSHDQPGPVLLFESQAGDGERNYAQGVISALTAAGYVPDVTADVSWTSDELLFYHAVFVGKRFSDGAIIAPTALLDYVRSGGGVYMYGGVGAFAGAEALLLNEFAESLGCQYANIYNGLYSSGTITSVHQIFEGIAPTGELACGNGQSLSLTGAGAAEELHASGSHVLYIAADLAGDEPSGGITECDESNNIHSHQIESGFDQLNDRTLDIALDFTNTTYNRQEEALVVTARVRNVAGTCVDAPLMLVIDSFQDPGATAANPDGFTPDGKPYYMFSNERNEPGTLAPGATTPEKTMIFFTRSPRPAFSYSLRTRTNQAPVFRSFPATTAVAGAPYGYAARAVDPDGHELVYALQAGPLEMTIDPATGDVSWPAAGDSNGFANEQIVITATDPCGGAAVQRFTLEVGPAPVNRPPVFTSSPVTRAAVGASYEYLSTAVDPDGDVLAFSKLAGPADMTVDPTGGRVFWEFALPGDYSVTLRVSDPEGAYDERSYVLTVGERATNPHAPSLFGTPATIGAVGKLYTYQPSAFDPDPGQQLKFSLPVRPAGMDINTNGGRVTWTPSAAQLGLQSVELMVSDGAGGSAKQAWKVDVRQTLPNRPPVIDSVANFIALQGQPYVYDVSAFDPEGAPITYALVNPPPGMAIDPDTGLISWLPPVGNVTVIVAVRVTDPQGAFGSQVYDLPVAPPNTPPEIISEPVLTAVVGGAYRHDVNAQDADGHTLVYSLPERPTGMTINAQTGLVGWTPEAAAVGPNPVLVRVADPYGGVDEQVFVIEVTQDTMAPQVAIIPAPDPAFINEPVRICVNAGDAVGIADKTLEIDSEPQTLDALGCVDRTFTSAGARALAATASDPAGNVGQAARNLLVVDPNDTGHPEIQIISPTPGTELVAPTEIVATITDPEGGAIEWEVCARRATDAESLFCTNGVGAVSNGVIAEIDPTVLPNDNYIVEVSATDGVNTYTLPIPYPVAGELKLGRFTLEFTDLTIPVAGIPLTVGRRYDSFDTSVGDFGRGWRLALPGKVSDLAKESPAVEPLQIGSKVYVNRPDGRRVGFSVFAFPINFLFPFIVNVQFFPDAGVSDELTLPGGNPLVFNFGGVLNSGFIDPFNPRTYVLRTKQRMTYVIDEIDGLKSITDANGNEITVTPAGLVSSAGMAITFVRDAQGRITRVLEPDADPNDSVPPAEVSYTYSAAGNLATSRDQTNYVTTYRYTEPRFPYYLTEIVDPLNRRGIRNEYDGEGRLVASIDAEGHRVEYARDVGARQEVIKDRAGNNTVLYYDERGNVILRVDAYGSQTEYAFDVNDRLIRETDCAGRVKEYTYDADGDVLTETNCSGGVTTYTRNANGQPLTRTDANGNMTTYTYDANGNLLSEVAPDGGVTTSVYNNAGQRISRTNPRGFTETLEYDNLGRMTAQVDFAGARTEYAYNATGDRLSETKFRTLPGVGVESIVTQYRYDAAHREIETIDALGHSTKKVYDAAGQLVQSIDPLNRVITNVYDVLGNLRELRFPDNTVEKYTYDFEGRRTSLTDRDGHVTRYTYDKLGRLVQTTLPDETPSDPADDPFTAVAYDCVGRIETQWDENSNGTSYVYDCDPNTQVVTDALGFVTTHEFDLLGSRVRMTDAKGHTTQYWYDGLSRPIRTIYHDGTFAETRYDKSGNKATDIDQDGKVTRYEHDGMSRLVQVTLTNAGQDMVTRYTYDELGNQLTQEDAEGRITQFAYDKLSRRIRRILPLGQLETMDYDAAGQLVAKTDFNGDTIVSTYDAAGRLIREATPDGGRYEFAFDGTGRRTLERIVRPDGSGGFVTDDTFKEYDARDRLVYVDNPDGSSLEYGYDPAGNRTLLIATTPQLSETTLFDFDALNRLWKVHHPDNGGVSTYTYDEVGNRASLTLPNATVATYEYDELNRLTVLTNKRSDNSIISRYAYTLSPSGQRLRVDETTPNGNARVVVYTYDDVYRLTGEQITDPEHENLSFAYVYDKVGNRMTRTIVGPNGTATTEYTYDANDRLLEEIETTVVAGANEQIRHDYFAAGRPVPMRSSYLGFIAFAAATGLPLLWPLGLLLPRSALLGRAANRRSVFTKTVALLLLPSTLISSEAAWGLHASGLEYAVAGDIADAGRSAAATKYMYDNSGNVLSRTMDTITDIYSWDHRGRLVEADNQSVDGSRVVCRYDVYGNRIVKHVTSGDRVDYLVDTNRQYAQSIVELRTAAGGGARTDAFVFGDDLLTMSREGTVIGFFHFDGQMSIRQLSRTDALLENMYAYDAFGVTLHATSEIENHFQYAAQFKDANIGFYYLRARYYSSQIGRFLSCDPTEGRGSDPGSLHKYVYAQSNPVHFGDPNGTYVVFLVALLCIIAGIVIGRGLLQSIIEELESLRLQSQGCSDLDCIQYKVRQIGPLIVIALFTVAIFVAFLFFPFCNPAGIIGLILGMFSLFYTLIDFIRTADPDFANSLQNSVNALRSRVVGP